MKEYPRGVSLIVCTYNGSALLPDTIGHINELQVSENIEWEFILIDNASSDDTQEVAKKSWDRKEPFRLIYEENKGLINARKRGIREAKYEYISFIDDDNWIDKGWINNIFRILSEKPEVGVCGGKIGPALEDKEPFWFDKVKGSYAIGEQNHTTGDVPDTRGHIWGAGMSFRKSVYENLVSSGFSPLLVGRKGKKLLAGEDTEISFAFRMDGWRLYYDEKLTMKHFITSPRLEWKYVLNMYRGFGYAHAIFSIYHLFLFHQWLPYFLLPLQEFKRLLPLLTWRMLHPGKRPEGDMRFLQYQLDKSRFIFSVTRLRKYPGYYERIKNFNSKVREGFIQKNISSSKFTIITPCLNAESYIAETIRSVLSQKGEFFVEYMIIDGGSTDRTLKIIKDELKSEDTPQGITIKLISEPDMGMYDAVAKGFELATGDIIAYLNADDFYFPGTLEKVARIFAGNQYIKWITGRINIANSDSGISRPFTPFSYNRRFIGKGVYNGEFLPFIQQESTFWRRELLSEINPETLRQFKSAGDYYLWYCFSKNNSLYILPESFAAFRKHGDQISMDQKKYLIEVKSIVEDPVTLADRILILAHKILWYMPEKIKQRIIKNRASRLY